MVFNFNEMQWLQFARLIPLQWGHNERDGVSNHQPHDCLLKRLFRRRPKKTSKLHIAGLCAGNSPVTGEFPHKWPVTRRMFPFDDVIMTPATVYLSCHHKAHIILADSDVLTTTLYAAVVIVMHNAICPSIFINAIWVPVYYMSLCWWNNIKLFCSCH